MQVYQNYIFLIPHNFIKSFFSNNKALQQKPKGWECLGSPYWTTSELLRGI